MGRKCIVAHCHKAGKSYKGKKMLRFPKTKIDANQMQQLGITHEIINQTEFTWVCAEHFTPSSYVVSGARLDWTDDIRVLVEQVRLCEELAPDGVEDPIPGK